MRIILNLPFPPSTNRLWRKTPTGMRPDVLYGRWKDECDGILMASRDRRWLHAFVTPPVDVVVHVCLDVARRKLADVDNRTKAVHDYLERCEILENDKQIISTTAEWAGGLEGRVGCMVFIMQHVPELQSMPRWLLPLPQGYPKDCEVPFV